MNNRRELCYAGEWISAAGRISCSLILKVPSDATRSFERCMNSRLCLAIWSARLKLLQKFQSDFRYLWLILFAPLFSPEATHGSVLHIVLVSASSALPKTRAQPIFLLETFLLGKGSNTSESKEMKWKMKIS